MTHNVDRMLGQLKALPRDHELDRLESAVFSKIEAQRDALASNPLKVQLAVTCGALLLGLAIAQFEGIETMAAIPLHSETIVLSDDSSFAPSVLLEGEGGT